MKFAVGYQLPRPGGESLVDIVGEYRTHIDEVYFPWLDMPSGRSPLSATLDDDMAPVAMQQHLEADLKAFREMGLKLNLLFNASCYGKLAFSRTLSNKVRVVVGHLADIVGLDVVTTMSPTIAKLLQTEHPGIDVRASVNMRLDTVRSLRYVADLFDSYSMQKECNRDLRRIAEMKTWCDHEGKRLHMLANSGCLGSCSLQTFHDNLVAHEKELSEDDDAEDDIPALCWQFYRDPGHWVEFLRNSWVRPEDMHHYEPWFSVVKLATRMHANPRKVIA
ncbi:MAG TPA: hypothetical protein VMX57_07165, partial [Planctomycetota bacterium]|nr:hypothetical protein [Planctomycetota bacterium]